MTDKTDKTGEVQIDPSGDLTLRIISTGVVEQYVRVSSKSMRLASPVWSKMLDPDSNFKEGSCLPDGQISLEDDYKALLVILNIAHLRFQKLPRVMDFETLLQLAVISDKYDCIALVLPWLQKWVDPLMPDVEKPGNEEWLFIAWVFGYDDIFERLAGKLVRDSTLDKDGERLMHGDKVIGSTMPPDIIGTTGPDVSILAMC